MVEIAICLAVIGFALVAIIGVLPTAMNSQRDNREETVIDQDATYWIEAIRGAVRDLEDLPDYVAAIRHGDTNSSPSTDFTLGSGYTTGSNVIGLLTSAALWDQNIHYAEADVYPISGPAVNRDPSNREVGLQYRLRVEIAPFQQFHPDLPLEQLYVGPDLTNAIMHELRLTFGWPLRPGGSQSFPDDFRNTKTYRTFIQGVVTNDGVYSFFSR